MGWSAQLHQQPAHRQASRGRSAIALNSYTATGPPSSQPRAQRHSPEQLQLTKLADDYTDETLTKVEYLRQKARITERMESALRRSQAHQDSYVLASIAGEPVRDAWEQHESDLGWRRALIATMIEKITIHPTSYRGPKFDPDAVEVLWRDRQQ